MDKQYILGHVEDLSAEDLAKSINQGIVTLDEIRKTERLDGSKRNAISKLIKAAEQADDNAWETVRGADEPTLRDWIINNPGNKHIQDAKNRINYLQEERNRINNQRQGILDNIRRNPNKYTADKIRDFLKNGIIQEQELRDYCNVPQSAIENLNSIKAPPLDLGATPDSIPEGFTEVYFWGYTGSGKSCALGAILHMAEIRGYLNLTKGPGNKYAINLKNIFTDDGKANDFLPAPTPLESTQYLPFTLKRPNESRSRSVSLIELSGEVFRCFSNIMSNEQFPTKSHENTFNSLNTFLKSNNRKIHFFFIDFDRENKPDDNGIKQSDYLAAASNYFKSNAVFDNSTDAIYVVLTKSDLMRDDEGNPVKREEWMGYAKKHLNGHNYLAFINTLKDICRKYSINGGRLTVEPFSLGRVYFGGICDFDGTSAERIVEILMNRISGTRKSILDVLNK